MGNPVIGLFGFVLIIITFIIVMFALPTMYSSVCTTSGCALENISIPEKQIMTIYQYIILILPFLTFGAGVLFVFKGVS